MFLPDGVDGGQIWDLQLPPVVPSINQHQSGQRVMMARQRTAEVSCSAERINEPSTLFTFKGFRSKRALQNSDSFKHYVSILALR